MRHNESFFARIRIKLALVVFSSSGIKCESKEIIFRNTKGKHEGRRNKKLKK